MEGRWMELSAHCYGQPYVYAAYSLALHLQMQLESKKESERNETICGRSNRIFIYPLTQLSDPPTRKVFGGGLIFYNPFSIIF